MDAFACSWKCLDVKLVMTLLVRDEADVVDAQIAFHLSAGVDFVIATDNGSQDGTAEILERYEREGRLRLLREPGRDIRQAEWVTRMARLAATDFDADWVINSDADEFWWPHEGSLKDALASVPERYAVVRGAWRHFLPRPEDEPDVFERMVVRLRLPASAGDKETIYHAHQKVAHRARADVEIADGNHDAEAPGDWLPLRGWYPLDVLHFSFRSRSQFERKAMTAYEAWTRNPLTEPTLHQVLAYEACRAADLDRYYGAFVVDDAALDRGLADGTLALDTRLRDALRALRQPDGSFRVPGPGTPTDLDFPAPTAADAITRMEELAPLFEIDGIARAEDRADTLEERLRRTEAAGLGRLRALGRKLGPGSHRRRLAPR